MTLTGRPQSLFEKVWDQHVVAELGDGFDLLHVDRHLLHDGGAQSLMALRERGLAVRSPHLTFATPDHAVSTARGRGTGVGVAGSSWLADLRREDQRSRG